MRRQQPEKAEQAAIVQLLESIGAKVCVLGTRRRKGDHPGTMQTPGLPDLYVFLPLSTVRYWYCALWIEVKALGGTLSPAQREFRDLCMKANQHHIVGGLNDVIDWLINHGLLLESNRRSA